MRCAPEENFSARRYFVDSFLSVRHVFLVGGGRALLIHRRFKKHGIWLFIQSVVPCRLFWVIFCRFFSPLIKSVTTGSNGYSKSAGGERKNRGVRSQEAVVVEVSLAANESGIVISFRQHKRYRCRHDVIRWIDWTSTPTIHQR